MRNLHDYFYGVAAACMIAVGTGFLAVPQYAIDLDKEAKKIKYQLEEIENIKINHKTKCDKLNKNRADCNYVQFLSSTMSTYADINKRTGEILIYLSAVFACFGVVSHYIQHKRVRADH